MADSSLYAGITMETVSIMGCAPLGPDSLYSLSAVGRRVLRRDPIISAYRDFAPAQRTGENRHRAEFFLDQGVQRRVKGFQFRLQRIGQPHRLVVAHDSLKL